MCQVRYINSKTGEVHCFDCDSISVMNTENTDFGISHKGAVALFSIDDKSSVYLKALHSIIENKHRFGMCVLPLTSGNKLFVDGYQIEFMHLIPNNL